MIELISTSIVIIAMVCVPVFFVMGVLLVGYSTGRRDEWVRQQRLARAQRADTRRLASLMTAQHIRWKPLAHASINAPNSSDSPNKPGRTV